MSDLQGLSFAWVESKDVPDETLWECSALYSGHYGIYGDGHPRSGDPVRMSPARLRALLDDPGAWAALARLPGQLVGYAFVVRGALPSGGVVSWVTQLVIHKDYRHREVATRLLRAAWGLSDDFGWGLVTANPYAVRALEAATRRRCDPLVIHPHLRALQEFGVAHINYLAGKNWQVDDRRSIVDTQFFVSHEHLGDMMERSCSKEKPWKLGDLAPGQEWLALTFREQSPRPLTTEEFERVLADHDAIVKEAYARMALDRKHKWAQGTPGEADFVVAELQLRPGDSVLDAGCGTGRHSLELAKRGYRVTGVDFVPEYIERANETAKTAGLNGEVRFLQGDCRTLALAERFDGAICLYDVIGSFPSDADNLAILQNVARHLKPGGRLLLSVLNRGLVEAQAIHKGPVLENLDALLKLPASKIMQTSGEIFDPNYYFFDHNTSLVYRKEQFTQGDRLPAELIVRDRRYGGNELAELCRSVGIEPLWVRHVRMAHWGHDYPPSDPDAKEVLLLGEKH
jgi:SAM-dependent methyltransferase/GNAT superfamily N-acetyltransferase